MKITFGADFVTIRGPRRTDGAYTITFETGEYEAEAIAELIKLPRDIPIKVEVLVDKQKTK